MRDTLLGAGWAVALVIFLFWQFQSAITAQIGFGMFRADFDARQQQVVEFVKQFDARLSRLEKAALPPAAK